MNLWPQLGASAALVCLIALVHAIGVVAITNMLGLDESKLRGHLIDRSAIILSAITALSLFALHFIEIACSRSSTWRSGRS